MDWFCSIFLGYGFGYDCENRGNIFLDKFIFGYDYDIIWVNGFLGMLLYVYWLCSIFIIIKYIFKVIS